MSVFQIVALVIQEGKQEEVAGMLQGSRDVALAQDGCEAYDIYQGAEETHRFVLVERWSSLEKHRAHFEKNVVEAGVIESIQQVASDMQFAYYEAL